MLCDIGVSQAHGEFADCCDSADDEREWERWAVDWVRRTTGPTLEWPDPRTTDTRAVLQRIARVGVCEVAAEREACAAHLGSRLRDAVYKAGASAFEQRFELEHWDWTRWLMDTALIPTAHHERLTQIFQMPIDALLRQDWIGAARSASRVRELRPDLAWPYGILGWAAQRDGHVQEAIRMYAAGLRTLNSSLDLYGRARRAMPCPAIGFTSR